MSNKVFDVPTRLPGKTTAESIASLPAGLDGGRILALPLERRVSGQCPGWNAVSIAGSVTIAPPVVRRRFGQCPDAHLDGLFKGEL